MSSPDTRQAPSFLIKQVARELIRRGEERLRPLGLGTAYLPIMVAVKNGDAATQADLARLLRVEQPSMAQLLGRMERDGFIRRKVDPSNRRSQIIELTALAVERLPQAYAALNEGNILAMTDFTPDEEAQFVAFLNRIQINLRSDV
ncbi:MarR family transcriptional regulator [Phyllobacterium sp. P30BS-XVII]|uniref:MarR family winged helix-turn-helix transcriptional regulator n=1 Tax=Phyllobacterium sp. P30BS-XVII TaxID=2587046 RepID=UPI000DDF6558|nr:MarR family transcriptional regulator [Phyllobacterium sp. P30BS-XVII]MBA8901345.1 DNA-binding MarR family transcriptional regulator [Phyllobacterium sp. P30BS-XVII]